VSLTERQMKIIETLQKNGKIKAGEVAKMFGITRQAALKELHKLVEPEVIRLEGKGRGAYYVMA
ncbi:MAG: winged helix-turn-helix transcriptional regulator, partial [Euryarchaeota archaeon]|nr:winged helix-turn-helix transcriptional regulator [Euryarchaeota archaeon]